MIPPAPPVPPDSFSSNIIQAENIKKPTKRAKAIVNPKKIPLFIGDALKL